MSQAFSFIILTFNEEQHLPRLLSSIIELNAPIFILDSGSTDRTLQIAEEFGATVKCHPFENHPKQWDYAIKTFEVNTPWTIGLDADQIVTPELLTLLKNFNQNSYKDIDGIYFNRKNFFKGKWIKYGGYYPKYLLKMFRTGVGFSDTNENMDHRFVVPGKTVIWKKGHILEENLKENEISFWIAKHNRYSDLVAQEEIERLNELRHQTTKAKLFGDPYQRMAFLKKMWWKMPRFVRPFLYFSYRMVFQLGILDGKTGIIFHFLQGFWFRIVVDIKIEEQLKKSTSGATVEKNLG
jgi:glycosyltransferase involved in cell wall biosynthesis